MSEAELQVAGTGENFMGKMRIEKDDILIRQMETPDLSLLLKWLTDERVLEWYEGRDVCLTMESLSEHFAEPIPNGCRVIFEYRGQPIGYGQFYRLTDEMFREYEYPDEGHVVYAMDQFIGEPDYWNRGIGTTFLNMMADYLKENRAVEILLLDPHKSNPRAVRAYEKAGFRKIRSLPEHELFEGKMEDCWLMEKKL